MRKLISISLSLLFLSTTMFAKDATSLKSAESRGWFVQPEINIGNLHDVTWGGGFSVGYELNPTISTGIGGGCYFDYHDCESVGFGANAYGLVHFNFSKTEGHWFGELRSGIDVHYDWVHFLIEPMVGYDFKPTSNGKGNFRISYGLYSVPSDGTGHLINFGYKF